MTFGRMVLALLLISTGTAWAANCKQPLDDKILNSMALGRTPDVQLKPGDSWE